MGFNSNRLKVQLKLSINRLNHLKAKKRSQNEHQRRAIATMLEQQQLESAKIRVEHIIREDYAIEALDMLQLYVELVLARFGILDQLKTCDESLKESIQSILYASPRCAEVKELMLIREQLTYKYGKEFVLNSLENKENLVNPRLVHKLTIQTPDPFLVEQYLKEIAKMYNIKLSGQLSDPLLDLDIDDNELESEISPTQPSSNPPNHASASNQNSEAGLFPDPPQKPAETAAPKPPAASNSSVPNFEELMQRFEALKKN